MHTVGYLDANSGSLIISAVVAGAAGVSVVTRMGWRRFTALFSSERRAELRAEKAARAARRAEPDANVVDLTVEEPAAIDLGAAPTTERGAETAPDVHA